MDLVNTWIVVRYWSKILFNTNVTSKDTDTELPTSVAQLDARLTGDQEVAGLTPAGSATFFPGD